MVQPLKEGIPSFCLACLASDNRFTSKEVLHRWVHIYDQLKQRGITLLSFSSDGDARLMKSMRITMGFSLPDPLLTLSPSKHLDPIIIPTALRVWCCMQPTSLLCIQDTVHIAVKLKARLLKPSIIVPMGTYICSLCCNVAKSIW